MKFIKVISCLLFLFTSQGFSQKTKDYVARFDYDELKKLFFDDSKTRQQKTFYANVYLAKAKSEKNNYRIARGYYWHAFNNYEVNNDLAIKFLDSVITYSKSEPDTIFPAAAYKERAHIFISKSRFNEAVSDFKLAESYALKTNIDFFYIIKSSIAVTKSEELGEVDEALNLYKKCLAYYRKKNNRNKKYSWYYQQAIFGLADVYKSLKMSDSSSYYNRMGYNEARITKNEDYFSLFILNEGANQILRKNYKATIDSVKKALPILVKNKDQGNILAAYYYSGKAYEKLNDKINAIVFYKKVDSVYEIANRINPEFVDGYLFLTSHYKEQGDTHNQLKYLNKYISIDSVLQKKYKKLYKLIKNEYDFPNLINDKEKDIQKLKNKNSNSFYSILLLIGILVIISSLSYYQYRQKKIFKERFNELLNNSNLKPEQEEVLITARTRKIEIADHIVSDILDKLNEFESQSGYLESNVTVVSLSNKFMTNSKYLSIVINEYKMKSFTQYVNDLRIDYAITILKNNSRTRKYTMQALSVEFGFNNSESFSNAFFKKTGLKPSYFIKELETNNL